jgi:hypothetical protein
MLGSKGDARPVKHLWRGENGAGARRWLNAKPGDEVTLDAHSSWSHDPSVASHFTRLNFGKMPNREVGASYGIKNAPHIRSMLSNPVQHLRDKVAYQQGLYRQIHPTLRAGPQLSEII